MNQLKEIIQNIILDAEYLKIMGQPLPARAGEINEKYKDILFIPPVREGDTVFSAIDDPEEPDVFEWIVAGIGRINGKWYVFDHDAEMFEFGSQYALPTRKDAEDALEVLINELQTKSDSTEEGVC